MASQEPTIGALWSKEKNGKVFLSGKINGVQVVAFQNTYRKEGSNQPHWNVYKSRDQGERPTTQQAVPFRTPADDADDAEPPF